jgi:hypothetical protein
MAESQSHQITAILHPLPNSLSSPHSFIEADYGLFPKIYAQECDFAAQWKNRPAEAAG